ncbi:Protein of unknown function [Pyronema omphalodes CBS 100304]|uniref:Uncharacterized protein n=1 Tax=Pyronema omphalodes (strain CBS 100304) TaxID=1076935 RepID=U4LVJ7_PYROM|nr:Protein of unknown function [Pyronema omphalodes CBS 100304]
MSCQSLAMFHLFRSNPHSYRAYYRKEWPEYAATSEVDVSPLGMHVVEYANEHRVLL